MRLSIAFGLHEPQRQSSEVGNTIAPRGPPIIERRGRDQQRADRRARTAAQHFTLGRLAISCWRRAHRPFEPRVKTAPPRFPSRDGALSCGVGLVECIDNVTFPGDLQNPADVHVLDSINRGSDFCCCENKLADETVDIANEPFFVNEELVNAHRQQFDIALEASNKCERIRCERIQAIT